MDLKESQSELNPVELEVLGILWEESPKKPLEIEEALSHPIENATLRSILVGLVEAGFLKRQRVGRAFYYRPAKAARTVRRSLTGRLASVFAGGSRLDLITQLIKDEKLTPEQIEELRKLAEED